MSLLGGAEPKHRSDRAESLFLENSRAWLNTVEDGGSKIQSAVWRSASHHPGAARGRVVDMFADLLETGGVHQRANLRGFLERIAHPQGAHGLRQARSECGANAFMHIKAIHAYASLAGSAELAGANFANRGVDIGIFEHEKWGLAAELEEMRFMVGAD